MSDLLERIAQLPPHKRARLLQQMKQQPTSKTRQAVQAHQIVRQDRSAPHYPLSFAQQRLWFFDQLLPGTSIYNIPIAVRLRGPLDRGALKRSLHTVIQRHEVLRTTFAMIDDKPAQVIAPRLDLPLNLVDAAELPADEQAATIRRQARIEAGQIFNLAQGPLLRVTLLRLGDDDHVLFVTLHHIITDGWSMGVLVRELMALYMSFRQDQPQPEGTRLPPLPIQYLDYAVWQREYLQGAVLERQIDYWRRQLADLAPLQLPTDRPYPAERRYSGASLPIKIDRTTTQGLHTLAQQSGGTLFMALLAAWQLLLHRYSGQHDIAVGMGIAGRNHTATESLIGFFINTLVLRTRLTGRATVREVLEQVRVTSLDAYAHQDLPFEFLVEQLQPDRDLNRQPLFQVAFVLQNAPIPEMTLADLQVEPLNMVSTTAKVDLTLSLVETADGIEGGLEYATELFDPPTIERMIVHFQALLAGMVADPDCQVADLPMLSADERHTLLHAWNDTALPLNDERCFHELVADHAARTPAALAVVYQDRQLTYAELDAQADRLARQLCALKLAPEARVGVCLDRGPELIVALLAIMKAGGVYVPLDPSYPTERLRFICADAQLALVITDQQRRSLLPEGVATLLLDHLEPADTVAGRLPSVAVDQAAYMIYTSGSTGQPKGVLVPQRGLVNVVQAQQHLLGLQSSDRVLQFAALNFDASVFEVALALGSGATLVLGQRAALLPGPDLRDFLDQHAISVVTLTPSALAALPPADLPTLRTLLVAGEAFRPELAQRWAADRQVFNLYGPTEATIWATAAAFVPGSDRLPIGRPIPNTTIYVLDATLQPVPVGVPGELYLGGIGVARGYSGRPALTATRFVPDPFSRPEGTRPGARLYRTGDLARWLPNGNLEYVGRIDQQIKLRGYRIELGEIEALLGQHEAIREAVVLAREDLPGQRRLVAYVTPQTANAEHEDQIEAPPVEQWQQMLQLGPTLRSYLQERLPDYMVPSAVVVLDAFPFTPNGKLDRDALPAPDSPRSSLADSATPPRTPVETMLVEIWQAVLGAEQIGIHDNFFALGGHSLLATQVISRIRATLGVELPVRSLFERPTIAQLAEAAERLLAETGAGSGDLQPVPRDQPLPLSFLQEQLWILDRMNPGSTNYNMPVIAARVSGPLDLSNFEHSFNALLERHETFRTTMPIIDGQPVQQIAAPRWFELPIVDLRHLSETEQAAQLQQLLLEVNQQPFDLERGPLWRLVIARLGADQHALFLTMHHIICDGWSIEVLVREFGAFYRYGEAAGGTVSPLPIQYADYAHWERLQVEKTGFQSQIEYWRHKLADAPPLLSLPTDHPRPQVQRYSGALEVFDIPSDLHQSLEALSRAHQSTLFMTLLAGFNVVFQYWTKRDDLIVGTAVANRNRSEVQGLIGHFVNEIVLRTSLADDPTFTETLHRVRETMLEAYAHQDLPFRVLVKTLNPERKLSHNPLFQIMFVLHNTPVVESNLEHLEIHPLALPTETSTFDLTLAFRPLPDRLVASIRYNADLFVPQTITRLMRHLTTILQHAVDNPSARLHELHQVLIDADQTYLQASRATHKQTNLRALKQTQRKPVTRHGPPEQAG